MNCDDSCESKIIVIIEGHIDKNNQVSISYEEYKKIIDDFSVDVFVNLLSRFVKNETIDFPYKKYFINNQDEIFEKLKNYEIKYDKSKYTIPENFMDKIFYPDNLGTMIIKDEEYEIDKLSDVYQEYNRIRAHKFGKMSLYQRWLENSQEIFKKIIDNKKDINTFNLRETIYEIDGSYECTQFKPTVTKELYNRFASKNVLDFSAGWGDRLIGALACDSVTSYIAYDPNKKLKKGHDKIIQDFSGNKKNESYKIFYKGFEDADLTNKTFDTVFTSPPFFSFEVYDDDDKNQSINRNRGFINWVKNFLFTSIAKCWKHLKTGGYLAIYIGDVSGYKFTEPMNIMIEDFEDSEYVGATSFANYSSIGNRRYIWIWKKNVPKNKKYRLSITNKLKGKYPNIFSPLPPSDEEIRNMDTRNLILNYDKIFNTKNRKYIYNSIENGIIFPYKRFFIKDPISIFENIKKYVSKSNNWIHGPVEECERYQIDNYVVKSLMKLPLKFQNPFNGKSEYILYDYNDDIYWDYDIVIDYFTEFSRIRSFRPTKNNKNLSPYNAWYNLYENEYEKKLSSNYKWYAVDSLLKEKNNNLYRDLRDYLYKDRNIKEVSHEKITFISSLFKFLSNGEPLRIFDACVGWGDRYIASGIVNAECYVGIEPNEFSFPCFEEIRKTLFNNSEKHLVLKDYMPDAKLPNFIPNKGLKYFNIGFISPPSYDSENYGDSEGQSINLFPKRLEWSFSFLYKTIDRVWSMIKNNGFLIIQSILIYEIAPYILWKHKNAKFLGPISVKCGSGRNKPMWIWMKDPNYKNDNSTITYFSDLYIDNFIKKVIYCEDENKINKKYFSQVNIYNNFKDIDVSLYKQILLLTKDPKVYKFFDKNSFKIFNKQKKLKYDIDLNKKVISEYKKDNYIKDKINLKEYKIIIPKSELFGKIKIINKKLFFDSNTNSYDWVKLFSEYFKISKNEFLYYPIINDLKLDYVVITDKLYYENCISYSNFEEYQQKLTKCQTIILLDLIQDKNFNTFLNTYKNKLINPYETIKWNQNFEKSNPKTEKNYAMIFLSNEFYLHTFNIKTGEKVVAPIQRINFAKKYIRNLKLDYTFVRIDIELIEKYRVLNIDFITPNLFIENDLEKLNTILRSYSSKF